MIVVKSKMVYYSNIDGVLKWMGTICIPTLTPCFEYPLEEGGALG